GSPNETPQSCDRSSTSLNTRATCSSALEGMQPRRRQVPPSRGSASTSVTSAPRSAAKNAAAYPPGPPPSTTSCECIEVLSRPQIGPSRTTASQQARYVSPDRQVPRPTRTPRLGRGTGAERRFSEP